MNLRGNPFLKCASFVFALLCLCHGWIPWTMQAQSLESQQNLKVINGDIPPDRLPENGWLSLDWSDPGGWNVVDVTTRGISTSDNDIGPRLSQLIDQVTIPTVFYFPPGTFRIASVVDINDGNIILRGAGADVTKILLDGGTPSSIRFLGGVYGEYNVTQNIQSGTSTIFVGSTSGIEVGSMIELSQDLPVWEAEWGRRSWGQIVFVTAINGNQLTVDMPIALDYATDKNPRIKVLRVVENVGVENMAIERGRYANDSNISFKSVYNGFVRDIDSYNAVKMHVNISRSRRVIVTGNYFHDAQDYSGGGHGYGVNVELLSTRIRVTNNIFKNLRHHILLQSGANHSIVSFNYNVDYRELVDVSIHGHFANHNLFEGNVVWWMGISDFWGAVGPNNMYYRNQILGKNPGDIGAEVRDNSDRQSFVANIFERGSQLQIDGTSNDIYQEGNVIGGSTRWNTLNNNSNLPPSLYRDELPDFWPVGMPWPAFGFERSPDPTYAIPAQQRYHEGAGSGGGPTNNLPSVEIINPESGTTFNVGDNQRIDVEVSDLDGTIDRVLFFANGSLLESIEQEPFSYVWRDMPQGSFLLTAQAIDNDDGRTLSQGVSIVVSSPAPDQVPIASVESSGFAELHVAANTLDEDLNTRWSEQGAGSWLQYSFPSVQTLKEIGIAWYRGDQRTAYFDLLLE